MNRSHHFYMEIALAQAAAAAAMDEVPIGAVLVDVDGRVMAKGHNRTITTCDPTAHAEIVTLREAAARTGNYRLLSTTLYVTVEPCVMCMGALIHARVAQLYYGAPDPRWGAAGSLYDFSEDKRFNHRIKIESGICLDACRDMMVAFFRRKRSNGVRSGMQNEKE